MSDFQCTDCALHAGRGRNYVEGKGDVQAKIAVIGEYPSRKDSDKATQFMAEAQPPYDRALASAGLGRGDIFCTYLVRCAPEGGTPKSAEVAACAKYLNSEISFVRPKVIVLLGGLAVRSILGKEPSAAVRSKVWDSSECIQVFSFCAGAVSTIDEGTGEEFRSNSKGAFKVVVGPSPSEVVTSPGKARDLARTFAMAAKLAAGTAASPDLDYMSAHNEEEAFKMLSEIYKRCDLEARMSFDIETSGLIWYPRMHIPGIADILSIAFSFRTAEAYALTLRKKHRSDRVSGMLKRVLEHPIRKCGHNTNFDALFLRAQFGARVEGRDFDTFVAASVLDQSSKAKGLDDLIQAVRVDLGRWWEEAEKYKDKEVGYLNCPDDILLEYNAKDADASLSLCEDLGTALDRGGKRPLFDQIVMPHYRELAEMQFHGVRLDVDGAKMLGKSMLAKARASEETCLSKVGRHPHWWGDEELAAHGIDKTAFRPFNLSSPDQLSALIYGELKAPALVRSDKTNAPSTSVDALEPLQKQFPFIADLFAYRKDQKFVSSFIGWESRPRPKKSQSLELFAAPEWEPEGVATDGSGMLACVGTDGRLHAEFRIDGTETGRISITDPALQTLPKTREIRNLLIAGDGYTFVDVDFRGLELRIIAILSEDPEFIRIFKEGLDPHSITASKMFGVPIELPPSATKEQRDAYFAEWNKLHSDKRKKAKVVNFRIPYGTGAEGVADDLNVSVQEGQKYLDGWAKTFPYASRWLEKTVSEARKAGGVAYSMGRFRPLPGFRSPKKGEQSGAERAAKNTPIQGTGGDCTSMAISRIHDRFRRELGQDWDSIARIVLEIHDQIVVEVLKDRAEQVKGWIIEEMTRQMPFLPPTLTLEVDAGIKEKWGD